MDEHRKTRTIVVASVVVAACLALSAGVHLFRTGDAASLFFNNLPLLLLLYFLWKKQSRVAALLFLDSLGRGSRQNPSGRRKRAAFRRRGLRFERFDPGLLRRGPLGGPVPSGSPLDARGVGQSRGLERAVDPLRRRGRPWFCSFCSTGCRLVCSWRFNFPVGCRWR